MWLIICTLTFMVFDFISGIIKALHTKEFCSSEMRRGLIAKGGCIMIMLLGFALDYTQVYLNLGIEIPIAEGVCAYLIIMETCSILENIGTIDSKLVPKWLSKRMKKLLESQEDEE